MRPLISITIIRSAHPGWPQVCTALVAQEQMRIVSNIEPAAPTGLGAIRPSDVVLAAADLEEYPPTVLQAAIRAYSSDSSLILFGSISDLDGATLLSLYEHGLRGYLVWEEVRPTTVVNVVMALRSGDLLIGSPAVAAVFTSTLERRRRPRVDGLVLTATERRMWINPATGHSIVLNARDQAVLRHLLQGQKQEQIARAEGISVRTVESHVAHLKEQFGVETSVMLGVMAERWGLVPA